MPVLKDQVAITQTTGNKQDNKLSRIISILKVCNSAQLSTVKCVNFIHLSAHKDVEWNFLLNTIPDYLKF